MNMMHKLALFAVFASVATAPAQAYIGPGGGLSAIGALLALLAGLLIAFFGFVWYPIRRMRRKRRERAAAAAAPPPPAPPPPAQ
jgi:uncharacterized iron-regulated membrane protein